MEPNEVREIFEKNKEDFLMGFRADEHPLGILLGGQGAVGKGQLNFWAEKLYPEKSFLIINGDNYRFWHPDFDDLRRDAWSYSKETQQFSSIFTECMIEEAIKGRISFVVEGTMRSPSVPLQTAHKLHACGIDAAALVIAAPKEFSL